MKILFVLRASGFLRNFEGVIREMLTRGHEVTVAVELAAKRDDSYSRLIRELTAEGMKFERAPRSREPQHRVAVQLRLGLDYLRYSDPRYGEKSKLRDRAASAAPALIRAVADAPLVRAPRGRVALRRTLAALDASAPVSAAVQRFLDDRRPDVLLVTPLVELGAPQTDWLRAARERGIPTALGVASWDNLTVKGGLREWPDLILVWNEAQIREACEIHGVPADRVLATGAHTYDHWFDWRPSRERSAFCSETGLRADRPFLLYLCSSPFIAPGEVEFVREWMAGLRSSSHSELREAGVLVRPHPQHAAQWKGESLADLGNAVVWPQGGADPVERTSRSDFYDSMAHCAAVVGVNTSAQIESAIAGREVFTLLDERFDATQGGTLHFEHLAQTDGGLLQVAGDAATHHAQLSACLRGDAVGQQRRERFLSDFVRPQGIEIPAAPAFVTEVERLERRDAPPAPVSPATLRRLRSLWSALPWSLVGLALAIVDPKTRRRTRKRIDLARSLLGSIRVRVRPPRTVAELAAAPSPFPRASLSGRLRASARACRRTGTPEPARPGHGARTS